MEQYIIQAFSVILNIVLLWFFRKYSDKQDFQHKKQEAYENGVRSLLRDRIVQNCIKYSQIGHVPMEEYDNITKMFEAYKALGGNGTTQNLFDQFMHLPASEMYKSNHQGL